MSIYDVGVENLPNIYINKIIVSSTQIKVRCVMKDHKIKPSWKDRSQMVNLRVKTLLVHDREVGQFQNITTGLENGTRSLFDFNQGSRSTVLKTESVSAFNLSIPESTDTENCYSKTIVFNNPHTSNTSVYVACYIEGLQFENPIFNKFYGPMVAEKIYVNSLLNTVSGFFYTVSTGEEYMGPVHYHSGKYMEGSDHRGAGHEELVYVQEINSKILVQG